MISVSQRGRQKRWERKEKLEQGGTRRGGGRGLRGKIRAGEASVFFPRWPFSPRGDVGMGDRLLSSVSSVRSSPLAPLSLNYRFSAVNLFAPCLAFLPLPLHPSPPLSCFLPSPLLTHAPTPPPHPTFPEPAGANADG